MRYWIESFGGQAHSNYDEIFIENKDQRISFTNLGARINRWQTLSGHAFILSHKDADEVFLWQDLYAGATVGRVAGRISQASLTCQDDQLRLTANEGPNHLHGGGHSFDLATWDYQVKATKDRVQIDFFLEDAAGSQGYPGNLEVTVRHSFDSDNRWTIEYLAKSDQATIFNPTNHVYFNLMGDYELPIDAAEIQLFASHYVPTDEANLPQGALATVQGTAFDLNQAKPFSEIFASEDPQIKRIQGLDHAFLLRDSGGQACVTVTDDRAGYQLEAWTDCDCLVVYSLNQVAIDQYLDGQWVTPHAAFTLEAQQLPDAGQLNRLQDIFLAKDQPFYRKTVYQIQQS